MSTVAKIIPAHIDPAAVEALIGELADILTYGSVVEVDHHYDACELQPTTRAAHLAAEAAVIVLLAHELGQEVGRKPRLGPARLTRAEVPDATE